MDDGDHVEAVPFPNRSVECRLCRPSDLFPLCDWCDLYLHGDFHFKRRHLQNILERGTSTTYAIMVDGVFSGIVILYRGSVLHNMYLAQDVRAIGLGAAIIAHFKPAIIRSKTNMKDGDPTPFYEANGYKVTGRDKLRPHIAIMERASTPAVDGRSLCVADRAAQNDETAPPPEPNAHPLDAAERRRIAATERSRRRRARLKAAAAAATGADADVGPLIDGPGGKTSSHSCEPWSAAHFSVTG
jgi:hypothetical protein